MLKNLKNIILISPSIGEASRVAQALTTEFGFVYAKINSPLALNSKYVVSVCSEVVDYSILSKFGCIIHLDEFQNIHPSLVAEKVFSFASNYFLEGCTPRVIKKCA